MTGELLPCPFCNGPAEFVGREGQGYRVSCKHCDARGGWGDYGYQAQSAWHKRAALSTPPQPEGGTVALVDKAHELWALAQLGPNEGIEDAVHRIVIALTPEKSK